MKNETILKNLRKALRMELSAMHQYQLHAHVLDSWGLDKLAEQMRAEMTEELEHSNLFMERIMFLNGTPEMDFYKKPVQAASLAGMFEADLRDEEEAIEFYSEASINAASMADIGTRTLFERVLLDEEGHKSWLELQLSLLERLGEKAFTSKYVSGVASTDNA